MMSDKIIKKGNVTERPNKAGPGQEQAGVVVIGGHFQGLGLLRSLARKKVPVYLLDRGVCIAMFSKYPKRFSKCPDVKQEGLFMEFLLDLAQKENLQGWVIFPNDDETVRFLAKNKEQMEKVYRLTTPSWDVVKYAYDKMLTYQLAQTCGVAMPRTFFIKNINELEKADLRFPVIIKPSAKEPFYSHIKKKAVRFDDKGKLMEEFPRLASAIDPFQVLMVQELIPGGSANLFSVGSLSNEGKLLARVVVRRPRQHPMDFGHASTFAETVAVPELEEIAGKILSAMNYRGLSEVEFMFDQRDGKYKLLEVNARAWGWHSIAMGAGVDLPYLAYLDRLGEKVDQSGFDTGVKWFRLVTDLPTVVIEVLMGRMKLGDYLKSLRGKKQEAVLALNDPLPFIAELIMLPYLWKLKGFW